MKNRWNGTAAGLILLCLVLAAAVPAKAWDGNETNADPQKGTVFFFTDAWNTGRSAYLDEDARSCPYRFDTCWQHNGASAVYEGDPRYTTRRGVDVSAYQGEIDWAKVKASGYDFAFIRLGSRGRTKGALIPDKRAVSNILSAEAAGLDAGCYFYSQAVSIPEAIEEAQYCLQILNGFPLQLPVMYDGEFSRGHACRNDDLTREQFTGNAVAFCNTIMQGGYQAGVYCSLIFEGFHLDVSTIQYYPVWYADYSSVPQTPYDFQYLQYSTKGQVPGISGRCDVDLQFVPNQPMSSE